MVIQAFAFYLFASILLTSAFMVITARNPVHSVLFLILAFFNSAGLFVLLGAEFIAFLMIIVYVGAVAVLFLFVVMMLDFVVMMLDVSFQDLRKDAMQYVPLGLILGGVLLFELVLLYTSWGFAPEAVNASVVEVSNTRALGQVLYTEYVYPFQIAGLILFVAMVGAIVLTHRKRAGVRKQSVAEQHARRPQDVLEIKKVTSRTGA